MGSSTHASTRKPARLALLAGLLVVLIVAAALPAAAFKPYTHVVSGQTALQDAQDGQVNINGRNYPLRPEVTAALVKWPSYYQAGVVGPDGFPDLTFGQSQIHPEQTGQWLDHIFTKAWEAQSDPSYSVDEKGQILAFAYGFLTHASGDLWAHTLVNDFAHGIFPGVGDILTDVEDAQIALRHIIVEGYIGDATPGFDGNPDRTSLPDGDVSDDSTPGIAFDAPHRWVYQTLVNPNNPLPVGTCGNGVDDDGDGVVDDGCPGNSPFTVGDPEPQRGPMIDYFLDLQSDLQVEEYETQLDREFEDCDFVDPDCFERTRTFPVNTVRGRRMAETTRWECIGANVGCLPDPLDFLHDVAVMLPVEIYLENWIEDIEVGLQHWNELGLASTRALFDPQARRNLQNKECQHHGSEGTAARAACEKGVSTTDVLFAEADSFIEDHLLSMLGAPDAVGSILEFLDVLGDFLDDIFGPALNPLRIAKAALREYAREIVLDYVRESYGIDIELMQSFLSHPTYWMDLPQTTIDLGPLGVQQVELFPAGEHDRLDQLLGLTGDDFVDMSVEIPGKGSVPARGLADDAEFWGLDIFENTVITNKLLLLDANQLNKVARDQLVDQGVMKNDVTITTYADRPNRPANVMIDGLGDSPWLKTIDGDHGWRHDGLPRFDVADFEHGGNGNFPLWESCLLRPSFRTLFTDWETDATFYSALNNFPIDNPNFPTLGDLPSSDPTDPNPPTSSSTPTGGAQYTNPVTGTRYFDEHTGLTINASDAVFTDAQLTVQHRVAPPAGPWVDTTLGGGVAAPLVTSADGPYQAQTRAGDPCNDVTKTNATSLSFVFDSTAPIVTITEPAPDDVVYDTDDGATISYSAHDGPWGSGVASTTASFDGEAASLGDFIDMFYLYPGPHAVQVDATDNLGHLGSLTRTFKVEATSESLRNNIERAWAEGLITDKKVYDGLRAKMKNAVSAHDRNKHATEWEVLDAFANQLAAQRDKGIDAETADRFIAHAHDIIERQG